MDEGYKVILPPHLKDKKEELNGIPDSFVFGLKISMEKKIFQIEEVEWGEFITYGSQGITKNDIGLDLLSRLEITRDSHTKKHLLESGIITHTILDMEKKKNIPTIGGTAVITIQEGGEVKITGKDIVANNNSTLKVKLPAGIFELKTFHKFNDELPDSKQAKL